MQNAPLALGALIGRQPHLCGDPVERQLRLARRPDDVRARRCGELEEDDLVTGNQERAQEAKRRPVAAECSRRLVQNIECPPGGPPLRAGQACAYGPIPALGEHTAMIRREFSK